MPRGWGRAWRGPSLTHRIDWVFKRAGMPLKVTAEYENWRRIEDQEGLGGWVHYSLLSGVRSAQVVVDLAEFHDTPNDDAAVRFKATQKRFGSSRLTAHHVMNGLVGQANAGPLMLAHGR